MARSLAVILAIFGCGVIGTSYLILTGEEIGNSITSFVMINFYHQTPNGQAFNFPSASNGIGIGVFAIILAASVYIIPKIMKKR